MKRSDDPSEVGVELVVVQANNTRVHLKPDIFITTGLTYEDWLVAFIVEAAQQGFNIDRESVKRFTLRLENGQEVELLNFLESEASRHVDQLEDNDTVLTVYL